MPAGSVLGRLGLESAAVCALVGIGDVGAVRVLPTPRWLSRVWFGPVRAMTLMRRIYVAPDVLDGDPDSLRRVLVHELVHVRQWVEAGPVRFLRRYLGDYLRSRLAGKPHRHSYLAIRQEVEARAIAGG